MAWIIRIVVRRTFAVSSLFTLHLSDKRCQVFQTLFNGSFDFFFVKFNYKRFILFYREYEALKFTSVSKKNAKAPGQKQFRKHRLTIAA